jgi:hypothetical protein
MPHVIAVIDDLLLLSRVREAAARAGIEVVQARGAFVKELPGLVANAASGSAREEMTP